MTIITVVCRAVSRRELAADASAPRPVVIRYGTGDLELIGCEREIAASEHDCPWQVGHPIED